MSQTAALPTPKTKRAAKPRAPSQVYLDELQAAEYIGMTARFMQSRRQRGDGPRFSRLGMRTIRYAVADLDAFMTERARSSTSDAGEP